MDHHAHHHHDSDMAMDMDMGTDSMTGNRCSMSMLFTWNTQNLCLVFRWWHVHGPISLIFSLLAVILLGMGYEYLRLVSRRYEARVDAAAASLSSRLNDENLIETGLPEEEADAETTTERSSLLPGVRGVVTAGNRRGHIGKGLFYGAQVFYSFFIMLLFMTYNGWVMIAVAVGSFLGYVLWGGDTGVAKSVACH